MPFAPATNAGSGHLLFAATSGFGKNLMGGLHDFFKNREESKGFDTLIENTARMNAKDPKFLETFGDQLSKAPGMSLSQKRNLAGSLALYEQRGRMQQEMALKQADDVRANQFLKLQQDQFAAGKQQREAQGRMSELLARYAAAPASLGEQFANGTAGLDQPAGLTLDRYLAAAGEAKAQPDPRVLEQFIQNGQRQGRGLSELQFQEDPVTGARMAVFGNSVLPTGINPAKQSAQAVDITDAEGNVIGRGLPGRNGFQLIKQPATEVDIKTRVSALQAQLKTEFNPDRRKQLQAELDALMKGGAKAAVPAAAGTAVNDPLGLFN